MLELLRKLKFNKHRKMERFMVSFFTLCLLLSSVTGVAYVRSRSMRKNLYQDKAYYNTEFMTSKTRIQGEVRGVFRNEDYTKSFVLLRFANIQKVSNDAEDYEMFLTGANVKGNSTNIKTNPSASIYMFGNTGYMGIYLVNNEGFDPQVLDLIIRGKKELVKGQGQGNDDDKTFAEYDQFRVYFNPGATGGEIIESLEKDGAPNPRDIYYDTVVNRLESLTRDGGLKVVEESEPYLRLQLDEMLEDMDMSLGSIKAYEDRLESRSNPLVVPSLPRILKGDTILSEEKEVKLDEPNEDGQMSETKTLRLLDSNVDFTKGVNFNWRNGNVKEGYVKDVMRAFGTTEKDASKFLATIQKASEKNDDYKGDRDREWLLADGTHLDDLSETNQSEFAELNADKDTYMDFVDGYYNLKKSYETDLLMRLLWLEVDLNRISQNTRINTNDDVLTIY